MSQSPSGEYHKMKDDEDSPNKFKFSRGDLIIQNKENDNFLGLFTPKEIDIECFCGCDLNSGIKVVSCFLFYIISFHFFQILYTKSYRTYFIGVFMCACYIIILVNIFQLLDEISYEKAIFVYRFFMFTFYMEITFIILDTLYLIIYDPIYFYYYTYLGLFISYSSMILTLLIESYMIWIIFCFMEHVKNNRLYLLQELNENNLFAISP